MEFVATTSGGWVVAITRAVESYGLDPKPLLDQVGIDLVKARDTTARFEVIRTSHLFRIGVAACGDPMFGLTVARMMRPTSWHALGYAILASDNLEQALERIARFGRVFTTSSRFGFDRARDRVRIWGEPYPAYVPVMCDEQYDAFLGNVVLTCRHLYPGDFKPLRIGTLRKTPPRDLSGYERIFGCPILFGEDKGWVEVDLRTAQKPLPTANVELAQVNDRICSEYIARFDKSDIQSQIYYLLLQELSTGEPAVEFMAARLHLSVRTLQRKLREQGVSYKEILDEVRRELAYQYMQQSHISISEICYLLGYTHVSNFSRAFKRWSGITPVDWRRARQL